MIPDKKDKLTARYRHRVEERIREVLPSITADGPKQIHHWSLPFWPKDRRVIFEILEERKRGIGPGSDDWHWTEQKIHEIERSARTQAFFGITGLILTTIGVVSGFLAL
jgi:hypothetical protein